MEKDTFVSDSTCILEQAGLSRFNRKKRKGSNGKFWRGDARTAEWLGGTYSEEEPEDEVLKKLFSPKMARKLVKKLQRDYDVLRLPEPAWIDDATGEWLDSSDHHECSSALHLSPPVSAY